MTREKSLPLWKLLKDNADQIKVVSGVVVAVFVLYQYCANQWQDRTNKTLDLVKDYNSEQFSLTGDFAALGPYGIQDLVPEFKERD